MKPNDTFQSLQIYAKKLLEKLPKITDTGLPITVTFDYGLALSTEQVVRTNLRFNYSSVSYILSDFPTDFLLLGVPGSGKSHSLKVHLIQWANFWLRADVEDFLHLGKDFRVPIYVDLKRYSGSLDQQIAWIREFLDLSAWADSKQLYFLIDAFNEAPRKYLEDGTLRSDLEKWIGKTSGCRWTIVSRTSESLDFLKCPHLTMADMPEDFVRDHLTRRHIYLSGPSAENILKLLRKPIFLSALFNGRLKLRAEGTHPAQAIEAMLQSYVDEIKIELRFDPDLIDALGPLAEQSIGEGTELFRKEDMQQALESKMSTIGSASVAEKIIDRLVQSELLLKYSDNDFSFYHQSITELIASKQIAKKLKADMGYLDVLLRSTRWNETLGLVLYYLDRDHTSAFFERLLEIDIAFAGTLIGLSEFNKSELTSIMLDYVLQLPKKGRLYDFELERAFMRLPIDLSHVEKLKELLHYPYWKGGESASHLQRLLYEDAFELIFEAATSPRLDYNRAVLFGKLLASEMDLERFRELFNAILKYPPIEANEPHANPCLLTNASAYLSDKEVSDVLIEADCWTPCVDDFICEWAFQGTSSKVRVEFLVDAACRSSLCAAYWLEYKLANERFGHIAGDVIASLAETKQIQILRNLERFIQGEEHQLEMVKFGGKLAVLTPTFQKWFEEMVGHPNRVIRLAFLTQAPSLHEEMWRHLEEVLCSTEGAFEPWEYRLLEIVDGLDWSGHESLMFQIINRRDDRLVFSYETSVQLSWVWLCEYLPWLAQSVPSKDKLSLAKKFPFWFVTHAESGVKEAMLDAFNDSSFPYRDLIGESFLLVIPGVSKEDISDESVLRLIDRLNDIELDKFTGSFLVKIVTESIVEDLLLPRRGTGTERFEKNLQCVLEKAGEKHRRRYL